LKKFNLNAFSFGGGETWGGREGAERGRKLYFGCLVSKSCSFPIVPAMGKM
jgi:hypothetical protein